MVDTVHSFCDIEAMNNTSSQHGQGTAGLRETISYNLTRLQKAEQSFFVAGATVEVANSVVQNVQRKTGKKHCLRSRIEEGKEGVRIWRVRKNSRYVRKPKEQAAA